MKESEPIELAQTLGKVFWSSQNKESGFSYFGIKSQKNSYFAKSISGKSSYQEKATPWPSLAQQIRNGFQVAKELNSSLSARPVSLFETNTGPMSVFEWIEGENLYQEAKIRSASTSATVRFLSLPSEKLKDCFTRILKVHSRLDHLGWIAGDLYDGSLIYDFSRDKIFVIDFDYYHKGSFENSIGILPGSSRFRAPEESILGAEICSSTTVFTLARLGLYILTRGSFELEHFIGSDDQANLLTQSTEKRKEDRVGNPTGLLNLWKLV